MLSKGWVGGDRGEENCCPRVGLGGERGGKMQYRDLVRGRAKERKLLSKRWVSG